VVLVGHSLGGLYIRLYAHRHPSQVAGLVFVDQSGVNSFRDLYAILTDKEKADARRNFPKEFEFDRRCIDLAKRGRIAAGSPCDDTPPGGGSRQSRFNQFNPWRATLAEDLAFYPPNADGVQSIDTLQVGAAPPAYGDRPVIVITTGGRVPPGKRGERLTAAGMAENQTLANASRRGWIVRVHSGHDVPDERPDVVLDAVRKVVAEARSATR
jgi:pimeloyl-ACP methyl ester carboxylesterase